MTDGDQRFTGLGSQIADGLCRSILGKGWGAEDEGEGESESQHDGNWLVGIEVQC